MALARTGFTLPRQSRGPDQKQGPEMRALPPPHLVRHVDRELPLGLLLVLGEDVTLLRRGEAALRRIQADPSETNLRPARSLMTRPRMTVY